MISTQYVGKNGYAVLVQDSLFEMNEDGNLENSIEEGMWAIVQQQDGKRTELDVRFSAQAAHDLAKRLIDGKVNYL